MKGVGFNKYRAIPPPHAQVYLPLKKDLSWMGLSEFVDDTVSDYTRPAPSVDVSKSITKEQEERWKNQRFSLLAQNFPLLSQQLLLIRGTREKLLRPQLVRYGNLSKLLLVKDNIDDKGYWDSGCSRYMTGNISYLSDYEPFNGRYVSFGHGRGKITGKGSIKTDESMLWHRRESSIRPLEQQSEKPKELYEEELKKMIELVPVEELYIEALQCRREVMAKFLEWSSGQATCSGGQDVRVVAKGHAWGSRVEFLMKGHGCFWTPNISLGVQNLRTFAISAITNSSDIGSDQVNWKNDHTT
nr:ribonuclease H-like domain-containing protein [Tanacetum cinerariifolium]